MGRDPRYDILFEPVRIGPLTARNRFYHWRERAGVRVACMIEGAGQYQRLHWHGEPS